MRCNAPLLPPVDGCAVRRSRSVQGGERSSRAPGRRHAAVGRVPADRVVAAPHGERRSTWGRRGGRALSCAPSRNSAVRLAERIVAALEEPFTIHDEVVLIGASVGIAFSGHSSMTAAALVNDADRAMYRAKAEGRARCVVLRRPMSRPSPHPDPAEVDTSLAHVAVSVARGERQINDLWRHSIDLRRRSCQAARPGQPSAPRRHHGAARRPRHRLEQP